MAPGLASRLMRMCAEELADLDEVTRIAQKTADNCFSIGMALTPCIVPQAGKPSFTLAENEMEMGMGIHGEPGLWRGELRPAKEVVDEMMDHLLNDAEPEPGSQFSVMVNSLGATPLEELYIAYNEVRDRLERAGVSIVMPLVGRYATSMEMTGLTLTLCRLDDELERLLKAPCACAYWTGR